MRHFLEALRFLSVLPIPGGRTMDEWRLDGLLVWFPLVGALLGGLAALAGGLAGMVWGPPLQAVCAVIALAALSGGLHLDGLSDTFDAVLSWRPRERMLEIMRDSRIGAMGAIALIVVLLLKIALIGNSGASWWAGVIIAASLGRWADLTAICFYPPARESGLGRSAQLGAQRGRWWLATLLMGAILLAVVIASGESLRRAALAMGAVALCTHILARIWTRQLGGLTGDTYGALCEIGEVVALAVWSAGRWSWS